MLMARRPFARTQGAGWGDYHHFAIGPVDHVTMIRTTSPDLAGGKHPGSHHRKGGYQLAGGFAKSEHEKIILA